MAKRRQHRVMVQAKLVEEIARPQKWAAVAGGAAVISAAAGCPIRR